MDLITAKVNGCAKSRQTRTTIFINVYPAKHKNEGDCFFSEKPDPTTQAICKGGSLVKEGSTEWRELIGDCGVITFVADKEHLVKGASLNQILKETLAKKSVAKVVVKKDGSITTKSYFEVLKDKVKK